MIDLNLYPPKEAQVGVYDGHSYGTKGLLDIHVDEDSNGVFEGSRFNGEIIHLKDGDEEVGTFCVGYLSAGPGTFWVEVPVEACSIYNEEQHDPTYQAKLWLASEEGKEWLKQHPLPRLPGDPK